MLAKHPNDSPYALLIIIGSGPPAGACNIDEPELEIASPLRLMSPSQGAYTERLNGDRDMALSGAGLAAEGPSSASGPGAF